ncbi:MAG: hypothetical protein HYY55_00205 [Candidatus Niyogibacteria bacterium]|nr:MAG: hypothetical protein HYY55_00205 [Candidatus Niyogibacteria bacterium]
MTRLAWFAILFVGFIVGWAASNVFPLPFPDRGHRLFGVRDEKAAEAVIAVLEENGLRKKWAFDAEPTHQVVMSDNMTVIAWFDEAASKLPKNAISVAVDNPRSSAARAVAILRMKRYEASFSQPMKDLPDNTLYLVKTDAMPYSGLVFRKPFWKMPSPRIRK